MRAATVVALLALALAACGGGGDGETAQETIGQGAEATTSSVTTQEAESVEDGGDDEPAELELAEVVLIETEPVELGGSDDPPQGDEPADGIVSTTPVTQPGGDTRGPSPDALPWPEVDDDLVAGPELTRDEILGVVMSGLGPNDNLGASAERVIPYEIEPPAIADTEVIRVRYSTRRWDQPGKGERLTYSADTTFVTPAERSDVVLSYMVWLEGQGWNPDQKESVLGGVSSSTVSGENPVPPTAAVSATSFAITVKDRAEGGSIVAIDYTQNFIDLRYFGILDGWSGKAPLPEGGRALRSSVLAQLTPANIYDYDISLETDWEFGDEDPATFEADLRSSFADSDWQLDADAELFGIQINDAEYLDEMASVYFDVRERSDDSTFLEASTAQNLTVGSPTPIPTATEVENDDTVVAGDESAEIRVDFAAPNGSVVAPDMDAKAIEALLINILAPTDDVAASLARLGPFPAAIPTMPDTRLIDAKLRYSTSTLAAVGSTVPERQRVSKDISSEFLTSASEQDTVLAVQTALAAIGWTVTQDEVNERDDVISYFAVIRAGETDQTVQIGATELPDGGSRARLSFDVWAADDTERFGDIELGVADGWYGDQPPVPGGGEFSDTLISGGFITADRLLISMDTGFEFNNNSEAEVRAGVEAAAAASADWAISSKSSPETLWLQLKDFSPESSQPQAFDDGTVSFDLHYTEGVTVG